LLTYPWHCVWCFLPRPGMMRFFLFFLLKAFRVSLWSTLSKMNLLF
jgi:hypothetical protein